MSLRQTLAYHSKVKIEHIKVYSTEPAGMKEGRETVIYILSSLAWACVIKFTRLHSICKYCS